MSVRSGMDRRESMSMSMDGFDDDGDESKRKTRNLSEKKRRDQFNLLVTELGTMVSPNNRKMDKTTVLKATIAFLKQHNEMSVRSQAEEIQEDWKPSFLSNEEFTHLMLEALDGFILVLGTDGQILYASESMTSLLGYMPTSLQRTTLYEIVSDEDKVSLHNTLNLNANCDSSGEQQLELLVHIRRSGVSDSDEEQVVELVKLSGYFRKWVNPPEVQPDYGSDDEMTMKSTIMDQSSQNHRFHLSQPDKTVFVATGRLTTPQLLREMPVVHSHSQFTSRHSLEWKFLFLDHRAPPIIGYLPFELLGTSGYDYYHIDDLDQVAACHASLMQTGEGTSCYYRFLTKGQQWIWLQTRCYITYHQWNSKPEFIVATHKVVNYNEVLQGLNGNCDTKSQQSNVSGRSPSPTWSSRSSMCGSTRSSMGGSNRSACASSSRLSQPDNNPNHDNNSSIDTSMCQDNNSEADWEPQGSVRGGSDWGDRMGSVRGGSDWGDRQENKPVRGGSDWGDRQENKPERLVSVRGGSDWGDRQENKPVRGGSDWGDRQENKPELAQASTTPTGLYIPPSPALCVPNNPNFCGPTNPGLCGPNPPTLCGPTDPGLCGPTTSGLSPNNPGLTGPSTPGLSGPSTPNMCGPSTPGLCGPSTPGLCGPSTPGLCGPTTPGLCGTSPNTPGICGTSPNTPSICGPTTPGMCGTSPNTPNMISPATPVLCGPLTPGQPGTPGNSASVPSPRRHMRTPHLDSAIDSNAHGAGEETPPSLYLTPSQMALQEQLRCKHAQLTKRIAQQQEELKIVSQQLLISQYGMIPSWAQGGESVVQNGMQGGSVNQGVQQGGVSPMTVVQNSNVYPGQQVNNIYSSQQEQQLYMPQPNS